MNKKFLSALVLVVMTASLLVGFAACDDSSAFTLPIQGIDGVSDAVIDNEARTVSFRVQNSIDAFPLSSIRFSEGATIVYEVYTDAELTAKAEGQTLPLAEGDNVFWLKGWYDGAPELYAVYKFTITRTRSEVTVVSLSVSPEAWKTEYLLNEAFVPCDMTATMSDGTTRTVTVTADMLTGFDTSTEGEKTVTVTYGGKTVQMTINVSAPSVEPSGEIEIGDWQSVYFIGDEPYLDGAYLVYDGSVIAITEDMLTGFDTSSSGEKTVTVTYGGATATAKIKVYALDFGTPDDPATVALDREQLIEDIDSVLAYFDLSCEDMSEDDLEIFLSLFDHAGVSNDVISSLADIVTADGAPFLVALNSLFFNEASDTASLIDALVSEKNVSVLIDALSYLKTNVSAENAAAIFSALFTTIVSGRPADVGADISDWDYEVNLPYSLDILGGSFSGNSRHHLTYEQLEAAIGEDPELLKFFLGYVAPDEGHRSPEKDTLELLASPKTVYIVSALLDSIGAACDYDGENMTDFAMFVKEVVKVAISGDIESLLSGDAAGLSYKEMVAQINELGNILKQLNVTFADDPLLVKAVQDFLSELMDIWDGAGMKMFDFAGIAEGILAADRALANALTRLTADFVAGVYLDYDDYAKETDPTEKTQKFGYLGAKIAAFIYTDYQTLSLKEKKAIDSVSKLAEMMFNVNVSALVDFMQASVVKDVDDFSDEELLSLGKSLQAAIGGERVSSDDYLEVMQTNTVFVPVGTQKDDLVSALSSYAMFTFYDADLGTSMTVTDLSNYAIAFDSTKEGAFTATVTIEGCSATVDCYAYDSTTASKFELYNGRHTLPGLIVLKGSSVDEAEALLSMDGYVPETFIHKTSGLTVYTYGHDVTITDMDTSLPAGLYVAKGSYTDTIFGTVSFPIVYSVFDPDDLESNITDVSYNYCNVLPQNGTFMADYTIVMSYGIDARGIPGFCDDIQVVTDGLDPSQLGKQTFTVSLSGLDTYDSSRSAEITVVTQQEAHTVTSSSLSIDSGSILFTEGEDATTSDELQPYVHLGVKYYPANYNDTKTVAELNADLEQYGLGLQISGLDTSALTYGKTATVSLVNNDGEVLRQSSFEYAVYSPNQDPAEIVSVNVTGGGDNAPLDEPFVQDILIGQTVFSESDISDVNAFLQRLTENIDELGLGITLTMTDGSIKTLDEYGSLDGDNVSLTAEKTGTVSSNENGVDKTFDRYKISLRVGYYSCTLSVKAISDALALMPTSIQAQFAPQDGNDYVLQGGTLSPQDFTISVEFGYGYSSLNVDASEYDKITVNADTSDGGSVTADVTYSYNGLTITGHTDVEVKSIAWAISTYYNYSFELSSVALATGSDIDDLSDALFGTMEGEIMQFNHNAFDVDFNGNTAGLSVISYMNAYWEQKGYDIGIYLEPTFDGAEGGLRTAQLRIAGTVNGIDADVLLSTVHYSVVDNDAQVIRRFDYFDAPRNVFKQSEIDSETYKDIIRVNYDIGEATLSEFEKTYDDAVISFTPGENGWSLSVSTTYAYLCIPDYYVVIPDAEAELVTGISISPDPIILTENRAPVAGEDFTLTVEYGHGVAEEELVDHSEVTVSVEEDFGDMLRYRIGYAGAFTSLDVYFMQYAYFESADLAQATYAQNCSYDEIIIDKGTISIRLDASGYGDYREIDVSGMTIAEISDTLAEYGLSVSVDASFDTSLSADEQTLTIIIDESPCQVGSLLYTK